MAGFAPLEHNPADVPVILEIVIAPSFTPDGFSHLKIADQILAAFLDEAQYQPVTFLAAMSGAMTFPNLLPVVADYAYRFYTQ